MENTENIKEVPKILQIRGFMARTKRKEKIEEKSLFITNNNSKSQIIPNIEKTIVKKISSEEGNLKRSIKGNPFMEIK